MIYPDTESTYYLKDYGKVAAIGISLAIVTLILMVFGWDSLQDSARIIFHQSISSRLEKEIDTMEENGGVMDIRLKETNIEESVNRAVQLVPGPYLQITVTDSGEGIAPEHLEFIFEPYFRWKNQTPN